MKLMLASNGCQYLDWSPIAAAPSQSAIAAVLAGFVFAGIVVVLSVRAHSRPHAAQALKLLFTAFFGLAVTAYLLAELAGEQTCQRAGTTEVLAGAGLGTFSVITVTALTWLVVAYDWHENVLGFLHVLVFVSCGFVVLLLCTNAINYIGAELPGSSHVIADALAAGVAAFSIFGAAIWIWKRPQAEGTSVGKRSCEVSITEEKAVSWCAWAALGYLAVSSVATGVTTGLPGRMWRPTPAVWATYTAAGAALVLPLIVLALAINAFARTAPGQPEG
jgi:hypothetical protein